MISNEEKSIKVEVDETGVFLAAVRNYVAHSDIHISSSGTTGFCTICRCIYSEKRLFNYFFFALANNISNRRFYSQVIECKST